MSKETYLVAIGPSFIPPEILTSWDAVYGSASEDYWHTIHAFDSAMVFLHTYEKQWNGEWEIVLQ